MAGSLSGAVAAVAVAPLRAIAVAQWPAPVATNRLTLVGVAIALGLVLDGVTLATGRLKPITGGRQVPREWTRLFDAKIVSLLFGARLGIGPLTILSTWGWWVATITSALLGVVPAVTVGATFGFVRLVVTVAVSLVVHDRDHASWFGKLRARRRRGWAALNLAGLACLVSIAAVGCSGDEPRTAPATTGPPRASVSAIESAASERPLAAPEVIRPTNLEEIVRVQTTLGPVAPETIEVEPEIAEPVSLEEVLTDEIDGFLPIDEPGADRQLDIRAAADIQPDPTEEIALLETRGFEGGWTRAFRNDTNDVAVTSVYQFEDVGEAEFYLEDGLITIGGYGGSFFEFEHLPGVRGFAQRFNDGDEELVSIGAAFQSGPRWFLTYIVGSPETVTPDLLAPIVAKQKELDTTPLEFSVGSLAAD